ncbi:hypothetical protein [Cellvibrio sp. KY-YJ-3]|uniref:hypothetical protein n=1 Tax=Cellvibrio sp. KY-YJ-3 TaxID=454662 RepID=UPI001245E8C0|nr:hypothetical protein [Cellvibrio sp. KY-YJ-3]QEY14060.1 hypothetical protein D0B88_18410 [Cellvibrio sp. KY-YJ-3]
MKKDINGDKNIFSNSEKNSYELGAQPRKSGFRAHKSAHLVENYLDEDDKKHITGIAMNPIKMQCVYNCGV